MKINKLIQAVVGAGFISASFGANAVLLDGVDVPSVITEFDSGSFAQEVTIDAGGVTGSFTAWGEVTGFNNVDYDVCPGCELTYSVTSDYTTTDVNVPGDTLFTGGEVTFFVDNGPATTYDATDQSSAENGTVWMTLSGHDLTAAGDTFLGTINIFGGGSGTAWFDLVLAGLATDVFDTNSFTAPDGTLSDFSYGSSIVPTSTIFTPNADGSTTVYSSGSGDLAANAAVPEPATLALLGLGLLGFCGKKRRSI